MIRLTLAGDPVPYLDSKLARRMIWDDYHQAKLVRAMALNAQFVDKPRLTNPIHVEYIFSFVRSAAQRKMRCSVYKFSPTLDELVKYVHSLAKENIYDANAVVSFTARKQFAEVPMTEIVITEVKNEKR